MIVWHTAAYATDAPQAVVEESAADADVMSIDTKGVVGNYLSSQYARNSGDIEKAIRYLRRAYHKDTDNPEIMGQLQGLLLINGNIEEAIQLAKDMPQAGNKNSLTALLLCLSAAKRGEIDHASAILHDAFEVSKGQLWLPLVMAWLDIGRHRMTAPLTMDTLGPELGRASGLVQYHLALINAQAGFTEAAADNFSKAITDPANPPTRIMEMLIRFYDDNGKPAILMPLVTNYRKENPDAAFVSEDVVTTFTPQDGIAEVLFTMGNVVHSAGAPQDAIIYLHMAHYLKPQFPLVTLSLGDAYSDLKQYERANGFYAKVDDKSPLYLKARLRMAMNESQMEKTQNALALLDKLAQKLPQQYESLVIKGDLLRTDSRFKEAVDAYTQALKRITTPKSHHWPIFFARGVCFERLNKWPSAEADLKQALTLQPDQPDVLNYLGYSWLMRREHIEEAREMIEKAVSQRPNDPQIMDSMGWALYSLGQYQESLAYLEKALELLPGDPTINDHLGDAYWQLGRKMEARFQWERSLTFSPAAAEEEAIKAKLKEGLATNSSPAERPAPVVAEGGRPDVSLP